MITAAVACGGTHPTTGAAAGSATAAATHSATAAPLSCKQQYKAWKNEAAKPVGNMLKTELTAIQTAGANEDIPAERMTYAFAMRQSEPRRRHMTEAEIKAIVDKLADIARVLRDADPEDKGEIFRQLGLKLTYHPGRRLVQAKVRPVQYGFFDSVRGGT